MLNQIFLLSNEFSRLVNAQFSPEQLAEVITKNSSKEYAGCCATHDYCDSNMIMDEAFKNVMGRDFIFFDEDAPGSEEQHSNDTTLINEAWMLSKSSNFIVNEEPEDFLTEAEALLKLCLQAFNNLRNQKCYGKVTTYDIAEQIGEYFKGRT